MNTMVNKIKSLLAVLCMIPVLIACEDVNWGDPNANNGVNDGTDKTGYGSNIALADVTEASMEGQLQTAMSYLIDIRMHKYQYQRSLTIDVFAGYFSQTHNYDGRQPTTYYYPNNPFIRGIGGESTKLYAVVAPAMLYGTSFGRSDLAAIGKILYAYSMQCMTDAMGPVAYHDMKVLKENYPIYYSSSEETYDSIFADLQSAVDTLMKYQPSVSQLMKVEGKEKGSPCNWEWQRWVKFANSIQLRMAITMSNVKPDKAREIAQRVVNHEIGVLEEDDADIAFSAEENLQIYPSGEQGQNHPLFVIANSWNDIRLNATLENILKRYDHPLLQHYFLKNGLGGTPSMQDHIYDRRTNAIAAAKGTQYVGIRQGVMLRTRSSTKENPYLTYSSLSLETVASKMSFPWIKVAEVLFCRAEGALRGWDMGGTAQEFYEAGIRRGFSDIGEVGQYFSYKEKTSVNKVNYVDYFDQDNNIEGRVNVGVKWEDSDDNELKLEKIITQKWIANFPMGLEAWTNFRRTGYPRMFPVKINLWTVGRVDDEIQLRRIPHDEAPTLSDDLENYNTYTLPKCEGGINEGGNPLWWDISASWTKGPDGLVIPKNNL